MRIHKRGDLGRTLNWVIATVIIVLLGIGSFYLVSSFSDSKDIAVSNFGEEIIQTNLISAKNDFAMQISPLGDLTSMKNFLEGSNG